MKYLVIAMIIAAGLYLSGGSQKAEALWTKYKTEQSQADMQELAKTRDDMFTMSYAASGQCMQLRKSALLELQCRNERQAAQTNFNAKFAAKLATGWKPEKP